MERIQRFIRKLEYLEPTNRPRNHSLNTLLFLEPYTLAFHKTWQSTILLKVFSQVQKNKDGSLNGISATELKKEIENSILETKKSWSGIDKVKVAEKVIELGIPVLNNELFKKINVLVNHIKKARD